MIDRDLALLYGVDTKVLIQNIKRNAERFPGDFMFQLTDIEYTNLRSQIVMSRPGRGGLRRPPYVFTEQGVAMLSSVLHSKRAVLVNIQIIRAFVQMRELIQTSHNLQLRIESLEKHYDKQFKIVFDAIRRLIKEDAVSNDKEIGFKTVD